MQTVKDQTNLAHAFVLAMQSIPAMRDHLRLVMVGDGPLRGESLAILKTAGLDHLAWLPGERSDIAEIMRGLDCFVLPSLGEGISNTILEAMASGLPIIATAVGGNGELVNEGINGLLVPPANPAKLAEAIVNLAQQTDVAKAMGQQSRRFVEERYGMSAMVSRYLQLYDRLLNQEARQFAN
jgi:glycosyltransferase involved in cell wall biosynthesis